MNFNDLLSLQDIDPKTVLVLRHRPFEPSLRRVIRWLAAERPEIFNAYQQTHGRQVEGAMQRANYVASFIGHEVGRALFVGLYRRDKWRTLTKEDFWAMPQHQFLKGLGMRGFVDERDCLLWFELTCTDVYQEWSGRLVVDWPGGERSWWRWSERNQLAVRSISEDSLLEPIMPPWDAIVLNLSELRTLPCTWRHILGQWRGIYFILDQSDGKGYVGSASGADNLLGRWMAYAETGHGGNVELKDRSPENFLFSILQRVSPDLEAPDVIRIEGSWKDRLHTREFGLNRN